MSELAHGLLLQDQGRLEEAESCFYEVLAWEPENDFVYSRLALCQLEQPGKKRRALESIDEAIRLRADEGVHHSVKSLILSELRRGKEALASADEAIAIDPGDPLALSARAAACCALDRWAEAEEWSRRALAADGDHSMAANLLAHALRLQGKTEENAATVEALLAADPEDGLAHVNAGWNALQQGDPRRAETHFREALRLDPDSEIAREGLLESFRARSRFYRLYLSYCFFMQRFTAGRQWAILIGVLVAYQGGRLLLERTHPLLAGGLVCLWLGLVMWVWLAPGVGNALVLLDRLARLALWRGEKLQGIAVGGGLVVGAALVGGGLALGFAPAALAGGALIASTVPASLAFANESPAGRRIFGGITAYLYVAAISVLVLEGIRFPAERLHGATVILGLLGLLGAVLCTWLGNVPALRRKRET